MAELKFNKIELNALNNKGKECYVYALVDPRNNKLFYIGKGQGNRVFEHVNGILKLNRSDEKIEIIKEIIEAGKEVQHFIIRWGMTESEALCVESTVIDIITFRDFKLPNSNELTNLVGGHGHREFGIIPTSHVGIEEKATDLDLNSLQHNLLMINVGQRYLKGDMSTLYDMVRKFWKLSPARANTMDYVVAVSGQITRGVFKVNEKGWQSGKDYQGEYFERNSPEKTDSNVAKMQQRYFFEGEEVTDPKITDLYLHKRFERKKGESNPVKYLSKDGSIIEEPEEN